MPRAEAFLQEALKLSRAERADVAAELLASLDDAPPAEADRLDEIDRQWGAEIERRARRVLSGGSPGVPWDEVERGVRDSLTKR